jgi:hypothetical protein
MKTALDEQWKRLRFGETIRNVIPFLPMELPQIEAVFRLKLKSIARRQRHIFWANLIVEDSLINHLSGRKSIHYRNVTSSFTGPSGKTIRISKLFAEGGARSIENGKPLHLTLACSHPKAHALMPALLHCVCRAAEYSGRAPTSVHAALATRYVYCFVSIYDHVSIINHQLNVIS